MVNLEMLVAQQDAYSAQVRCRLITLTVGWMWPTLLAIRLLNAAMATTRMGSVYR